MTVLAGLRSVVALAIGVGLCACGTASPAASSAFEDTSANRAAASPVAVSPEPGTPDASPSTQISFLGPQGTHVAEVHVVGSHSGVHTGVLRAYSTGTGESFLPAHQFTAGERVKVSARVSVGSASYAVSTSFTVAHQASVSQKEFPLNPGNSSEVQHYSSAPTLTPSALHITTPAHAGAAPGDLLLAPYQGDGTPGPMIAEQNGNLVWFHPLPAGEQATSLKLQQYQGKNVLTWWQGRILEVGFGQGEDVIYNSAYQKVAGVRAGNGYDADLHEFRLTPEGTAWIDAFDPIDMNLAPYGGRTAGIINDSIVEEVDVKTGLVMWEWHALGHIPIGESHNAAPKANYPWDYVHINSVDPGAAGDVLLSSRNTWTLYDVDIASGAVRWRIGGEHSSFKLGAGTHAYWQHDAEWQPGGLISVFDNGSDPPKEKQSRGLLLDPNVGARTVTLVKQFVNPSRTLLASSQGNLLGLPGGGWLMGYGGLPNFTEYDASGHVLLDGTLGKSVQDFRTYITPWSGQPTTAPAVVARPGVGGAIAASMSWNGASEVASWRVLVGASPGALVAAGGGARTGFQTTIAVPGAGPYVAVQALNASGAVIGTSATVKD
ncbi:MAG TPA: arylsulfotransferase family protein [Solirubrobacteraceae bacterium]|nr:arylsulfotransferase family protein [Solirubrobacteraceae bacterium]